jgi:hypothetical protein
MEADRVPPLVDTIWGGDERCVVEIVNGGFWRSPHRRLSSENCGKPLFSEADGWQL